MRVLGLATHTHDAGVALVENGIPRWVLEEERLNREKKTKRFPTQSLDAIFGDHDLSIDEIDAITIPWDIPRFWRTLSWALLRKFPWSLQLLHMRAHPPQQNQLFRGRPFIRRLLANYFQSSKLPPLVRVPHHHAHAAAFFVSPFDEATVLVMDGYGDDASTSAYVGSGNQLRRMWRTNLFQSLGILYTVVTQHLGFLANQDEGKVMGLAAYGGPSLVEAFRDVIRPTAGGRYQINMDYFHYDCYGLARPVSKKFERRFGPPRHPEAPISNAHRDLAFALQANVEEIIVHLARDLADKHSSKNLVLSGGVALNCVANARILDETPFQRIWIPPNPSDSGVALGSALYYTHQMRMQPRSFRLKHPYYGIESTRAELVAALEEFGLTYEELNERDLIRRVATDLAAGKIVGWFQGRFEMGPRALGNRSILADPRRPEMKDVLNRRVKHRESFRPFAPVILAERLSEWFDLRQPDPFMTIAPRVVPGQAAKIPAAVHADGTGRIQTVAADENPRYYALIEEFERITGVPILLNTSFNRQEPIVARPEEATSCYLRTDMDVLVLGNFYSRDRNRQSRERASAGFGRSLKLRYSMPGESRPEHALELPAVASAAAHQPS